jgi:glycine dehydrogenase
MLSEIKCESIDKLTEQTVPRSIWLSEDAKKDQDKHLGNPISDVAALGYLRAVAQKNQIFKSYIGLGYNPVIVPPVVLRNVLENPAWYTSYTPYQAEISQGRLESLLNYQTLITEITGLPFSNASLLDEATSAAEAMYMAFNVTGGKKKDFFISENIFPYIKDTIRARAHYIGINIVEGNHNDQSLFSNNNFFGGMVQNPDNFGKVQDFSAFTAKMKEIEAVSIVAADIMSLLVCKAPGDMGFDVAVGSAQRFGVPMMNGGPHAGFLATRDEYKRKIPGRVIGLSRDKHGNPALRLSMQTREQHIRRDKATSNICTAQALLANMAAFYSIHHGKKGLVHISQRINLFAGYLSDTLSGLGYHLLNKSEDIFDSVFIDLKASKIDRTAIISEFENNKINLRIVNENTVSITLNETTNLSDIEELVRLFSRVIGKSADSFKICHDERIRNINSSSVSLRKDMRRNLDGVLNQDIFNKYTSEHQLTRYMYFLQMKDISLCNSMISLGSCTMKLNATSEMIPVTWPEFSEIHPFAKRSQLGGYTEMIDELSLMLCKITQFDAVSLQPNSGANGEYAGLLAIRRYFDSIGEGHRNICLIPASAHGTNPASAAVAGLKVVVVSTDKDGNISIDELKKKAEEHGKNLCSLMVTYPSTHGVFEENIKEITGIIHSHGGQVYMDGANMNAQVQITSPATIGADVCHLNLHKTFCIPHGGGGPGVGPICVKAHLKDFLPGHFELQGQKENWALTSAPFGSAGILPISYMYIKMLGSDLRKSTEIAILNANYMMERVKDHFKILYKGFANRCAHEFILDIRDIKKDCGITEEDIAKRLSDYGFHAPTMSFPVPGTLMVEPTESEDK